MMEKKRERLTGNWAERRSWLLEGTHLELWPEAGSGYWLVVDARVDERVAGPFAQLAQAKMGAERLAKNFPERFSVEWEPKRKETGK